MHDCTANLHDIMLFSQESVMLKAFLPPFNPKNPRSMSAGSSFLSPRSIAHHAHADIVRVVADPLQQAQGLGEDHIRLGLAGAAFQALDVPLPCLMIETVKFTFHITHVLRQVSIPVGQRLQRI